jgi:hypothetical protein
MPLIEVRIDNPSPAMGTRHAEVNFIARALALAAHEIQRNGGAKTAGTILTDGAKAIGSWTYEPQAPS